MRFLRLAVLAVLAVVGAIVAAACGSTTAATGPASVAEGCRVGQGGGVSAHATTQTYIVQLDIGPMENMYTQAEAESQHPSTGEVMVRGQMSAVNGATSATPGPAGAVAASGYHLEAHICSKAGGAVIQDAYPTITLINDETKSRADVEIAVMQGVSAGVNDLHYGNNVVLTPGASYSVVVALNGQSATLHARLPSPGPTATTLAGGVSDMPGMP
ncbi:MAG: hypothetical protein M3083_23875 [Actinomycetota bacterium]|nr:hypothetical protein [Actinomycetota bacterium]